MLVASTVAALGLLKVRRFVVCCLSVAVYPLSFIVCPLQNDMLRRQLSNFAEARRLRSSYACFAQSLYLTDKIRKCNPTNNPMAYSRYITNTWYLVTST